MAAPAREAAFRILREIASAQADLGDALSHSRDHLADARDRALATELVTGTLRWRNALDYQLQRLSSKPLHKLDHAVLDALRLGAYQLLHLERVPVSAVVNDSVDLVKRHGFRSASGFANAILRRLARERGALSWPDRAQLVDHLAVVHSHPAWLVERWLARYGETETGQWLAFNNEPPALTLAANRLRGTRDELIARLQQEHISAEPTRVAPHGVTVTTGRPLVSQAFADGYCVVQDEASQIVPELMRAAPGSRVLDLCASPGGKTLALAAQSGSTGMVAATDVRSKRVRLLVSTLARCRARRVNVLHIGATGLIPFRDEAFDAVLIDAPCSGLGTIRRDPDIRWRRDPSQFGVFAQAQGALLRRAARVVKPGGHVVYSTCSSEPEENEDVVAEFLNGADDFRLEPIDRGPLPSALRPLVTPAGHLRTSPAHGLEAFFGAILRKR
jgi:16S rRNA (cytosine967-C5)-methyltransferase